MKSLGYKKCNLSEISKYFWDIQIIDGGTFDGVINNI